MSQRISKGVQAESARPPEGSQQSGGGGEFELVGACWQGRGIELEERADSMGERLMHSKKMLCDGRRPLRKLAGIEPLSGEVTQT